MSITVNHNAYSTHLIVIIDIYVSEYTFTPLLSWKKLSKEIHFRENFRKQHARVSLLSDDHTCGENLEVEEKNVHNYPSKRTRRMTVNRRGNIESRWRGEPANVLFPHLVATSPHLAFPPTVFDLSYAEIYRRSYSSGLLMFNILHVHRTPNTYANVTGQREFCSTTLAKLWQLSRRMLLSRLDRWYKW